MTAHVEFHLTPGTQPLILVPAHVNGLGPFPFVLDTGAGICLIAPRLARRTRVPVTSWQTAFAAGGPIELGIGRLDSLAVGQARVQGVPVAITGELTRIGRAVRSAVHGDVGYGFLRHFRVSIDYANRVLSLARPEEEPTRSGVAGDVAFRVAHPDKPLVLVPARINGAGPFTFALDTGASSTLVSPSLADRLGILRGSAMAMMGGGGPVEASFGSVASLGVGGASRRFLDVAVSEFLDPLSTAVGEKLDGILGYNFLEGFRVTIDYPAERLRLDPAPVPQKVGR